MRVIRNAVLSYGLVNVPVGVATAAKRQDFEFRSLHSVCETPLQNIRQCPSCNREVGVDEIVKGYEFSKKQFVVLDDGEMEMLSAERSPVISIKKFVSFDDVDDLQVEASYYLAPNDKLLLPYQLLSESMSRLSVVGVGSQCLWGKETPAMIWPNMKGVLLLSKLYCHDEVVQDTELVSIMRSKEVSEEAQRLADEYVSLSVGILKPKEDFVSEARSRMDAFLESAIVGEKFKFVEPEKEPEVTVDVMAALKESILAARS